MANKPCGIRYCPLIDEFRLFDEAAENLRAQGKEYGDLKRFAAELKIQIGKMYGQN